MLKQARSTLDIDSQVLFLKDSIHTTNEDRLQILKVCKTCNEDKIIITHGTDTMELTAKALGESELKNKTIILLGAMTPYNKENSDALFNLGCAIASVQILQPGIYITMNGKVFHWNNVRKNKEQGLFETI